MSRLESLEGVYAMYKGKRVFDGVVPWPSVYHFRLLAFTRHWRTDENRRTLIEALANLARFSPIPQANVLDKRQLLSPGAFAMHDFDCDMGNLSQQGWMTWFHRTELIARLGIAGDVPWIEQQIGWLRRYLDANDGFFVKRMSHYYFTKWTAYIGLALEDDWGERESRVNDLTFRSLLIINLANGLVVCEV